ncbi:MAG: M56 family metallopeptidase [Oscillospiraceae bacterium]
MIYLQAELPPQRRELVLRHEWNHLRMRHSWMKSWANIVLVSWWWNPILWVAYYYFCRDMELACDERTLQDLEMGREAETVCSDPGRAGLQERCCGASLWPLGSAARWHG